MIAWDEHLIPVGVERLRTLSARSFGKEAWLVWCTHDAGYRRLHDGGEADACRVCHGTRDRTKGFTLPVKMMAQIRASDRAPVEESALDLTLF